ncbi:MAG: hypothetical protein ACOY3Z_11020 [Thermodesulfobacteriota bacterium]
MAEFEAGAQLCKVTTTHDQVEDRLRLAGEDGEGNALVLWITQRLANRLIEALVGWLHAEDAGAGGEIGQAWRQDEALLQWQGGAPVEPGIAAPEWLVETIDLGRGLDRYTLTFRGCGGGMAVLPLSGQELRQWLAIVHGLYRQAGWPCQIWPAWFENPSPGRAAQAVH